MPAPYTDNTFTTAKQDGPTRVAFPFINWPTKDNTCRQYTQDMVVLPGSFAPLAALSTWPGDGTFSANANIYLVEETDPVPDLGAYRFQRVYASVPSVQNVYSSLLIVRPNLHGYRSGTHYGVSFDDGESSHVFNTRTNCAGGIGSITSNVRTITTTTGHGGSAGLFVAFWNENVLLGYTQARGVTATTIDIDAVEAPWSYANLIATAVQFTSNAIARYVNGPVSVSTKEVKRYYLPGVTAGITTPEDIPLIQPQTDPISWLGLIAAGTSLGVVKGSELKVWQGPIYEQTTIYAQMSDALETITTAI